MAIESRKGLLAEWLLALWLAAFWVLSSETGHRVLLGVAIAAFLARTPPPVLMELARQRWLWLAGALLGWQTLSRLWSGDGTSSPGWWLDALMVAGLLLALSGASRGRRLGEKWLPLLAVASAGSSAISLLVFYQDEARNLADDRLRNILFYTDGLNAVPTGFLLAFGALVAASLSARRSQKSPQWQWAMVSAVSFLGLLATQSRGPLLMFAAGFLVLAVSERKRVLPTTFAAVGVAIAYTLLLLAHPWREAAADMIERGTTGRLDIYRWYLAEMTPREMLIGVGMASSPEVQEGIFDWRVIHPHSIYLTQFYLTGMIGLAMLVGLIVWAMAAALALARSGESLWLCLLSGGCLALWFDGGQVFTVYSSARIELLLVAVPLAIVLGKGPSKDVRGSLP